MGPFWGRSFEPDGGLNLTGERKADAVSRVLQTTPPKCVDCRQYLDDPDLKFFQGDPDDAVRDLMLLLWGRGEPSR